MIYGIGLESDAARGADSVSEGEHGSGVTSLGNGIAWELETHCTFGNGDGRALSVASTITFKLCTVS